MRPGLPPAGLMLIASMLFALMGAAVKWASATYQAAEIVMYRGIVGLAIIAALSRFSGESLRTAVPMMHLWRGAVGVAALGLWFYAIRGLPLGTAVTLNYLSSVWMALFLVGGAWMTGQLRDGIDGRLIMTVCAGFAGVALVLKPTLGEEHLWHGLCGLMSGVLAALAYFQITALGRRGEPESRVVFYFSLAGVVGGALVSATVTGFQPHSPGGALLLLTIGVLATFAQLCMTRAYAVGHVLSNAALQYLGVAFSFILGVWWFDDRVTWSAVAGMALIAGSGIAATVLRARQGSPGQTPTET